MGVGYCCLSLGRMEEAGAALDDVDRAERWWRLRLHLRAVDDDEGDAALRDRRPGSRHRPRRRGAPHPGTPGGPRRRRRGAQLPRPDVLREGRSCARARSSTARRSTPRHGRRPARGRARALRDGLDRARRRRRGSGAARLPPGRAGERGGRQRRGEPAWRCSDSPRSRPPKAGRSAPWRSPRPRTR